MPTIHVYRDSQLLESFDISEAASYIFLVAENPHSGLYWQLEYLHNSQQRDGSDGASSHPGGDLQLMLGGKRIERILPSWELHINGKRCEQGSYRRLLIQWPKVELIYKAFRFELLYPELETEFEAALPKPFARRAD